MTTNTLNTTVIATNDVVEQVLENNVTEQKPVAEKRVRKSKQKGTAVNQSTYDAIANDILLNKEGENEMKETQVTERITEENVQQNEVIDEEVKHLDDNKIEPIKKETKEKRKPQTIMVSNEVKEQLIKSTDELLSYDQKLEELNKQITALRAERNDIQEKMYNDYGVVKGQDMYVGTNDKGEHVKIVHRVTNGWDPEKKKRGTKLTMKVTVSKKL